MKVSEIPKSICSLAKVARSYVLLTAAHNEEANIERTIRSVLLQTLRPLRWVIVSDNSSDRTDDIVQRYANSHPFINFLRIDRPSGHSFAAKVVALRRGANLLQGTDYQYIGNLDADVAVDPCYFETLIEHFEQNPSLGVTGGFVYEEHNGEFTSRKINRVRDVAHAGQLVRRGCYEMIGGYAVLKYGGEDWHAETSARMKGWWVEAVPTLRIYHQRHTGARNHPLKHGFRLGRLDYSFGSHPVFELIKCLRRLPERPYVFAALARLTGFSWGYVVREPREVSEEFVAFLRKEQSSRVGALFGLEHQRQ